MPINTDLLIAAPMLQDAFVDKDGLPMSGGTVTCYKDDSRTTLKNWYYQTGTPGNYTWLPLPNPLTLSAAGTICDINGVDTIPFFYPYLETDETTIDKYYITIVNHSMTNQITRANFPFNVEAISATISGTQFNNLIINNGFWRNVLPNYLNVTPYTSISIPIGDTTFLKQNIFGNFAAIVSPSQHDGFIMPECQYIKNNRTSADDITFTPFPLQSQLTVKNTNTPENYIAFNCTSAGTSETLKCFQFPIALHINNLANLNYTVSIIASSASSSAIQLNLYQFTGTTAGGTSSPAPTVIASTSLQLTPTMSQYSLTDVFPPANGLTLGIGEDDAFYLQVSMPFNALCNVNFTKPSLYLTNNEIPTVDFQNYDQVNSIICAPRTADIRIATNVYGVQTGLGGFGNFGWVYNNSSATNLATIGTLASGASARQNNDTWILFYTLYNAISNIFCPVSGGRTGNAFADFAANKTLQLPEQIGRFIGAAGADGVLPSHALGETQDYAAGAGTNLGGVFYDVYFKL